MVTFIGYTLTVVFTLFFLCYIRKLKVDLKRAELLLESSNFKLLNAKRERMHYKVAAELLIEEKNSHNTVRYKGNNSRQASADRGSSRQTSANSRQLSDDSGPITAAMVATSVYSGSSYDSSPSCDTNSPSSPGSCD